MYWWWGFLIYFGFVVACCVFAFFHERHSKDERISKMNPLFILLKLVTLFCLWYFCYLLVLFALDLATQTRFSLRQCVDDRVFTLRTSEGLVALFSYLVSTVITLPIASVSLESQPDILADLCFSVWILHFIVVCCVTGRFPTTGGWWIAHGVGGVLFIISSLILNQRLELLSMPSTRARNEKKEQKERQKQQSQRPQSVEMSNL